MMTNKGHTVIELICILSMVVVLSLCTLSGLLQWKQKVQKDYWVHELIEMIQYSKINAIKTGSLLYLEPISSDADWSRGVSLFKMNSRTKTKELINQWKWSKSGWSLSWIGISSKDRIIFSGTPGRAISNGRFILTHKASNQSFELILNKLGRIKRSPLPEIN